MKFTDFLMKHLLSDTDQLVGYDENGNYIRVKVSDLRTSLGVANVAAQTVQVQYSNDESIWHDTFVSSDVYMRIKAGSGAWSAAIRIAVSAYEVWREYNGGTGTVEEFLSALRGEAGQAVTASSIQISELGGYSDFLSSIQQALSNAKTQIALDVTGAVKDSVKAQFNNSAVSDDVKEIKALSDDDYITVVTGDGLRKVKISNLVTNVSLKTASKSSLESVTTEQRRIITLYGEQDGSNVEYNTGKVCYMLGTSDLYLNGQRLAASTDYVETNSYSITLLTQIPKPTDKLVFLAILQ